ncbi:FKBP-type peptidyl-prolyl cis-trans isomerase [Kutzneria kofuensis]|uniref:Peptidyl-prolyl cis-trans isomerase n=1 Tax=Kutzneria kofuensis TaxID=103725 RepID=A0A7W9KBK0_9PSEU|nr:FKBP-type peptidyl-prolyl cis-trans isomerase [Kutzneria kofuensis]MBB5889516.1 FKBP-type peptidyl-prolyl cis-trans isomerase [Kutzneria kofuensis]
MRTAGLVAMILATLLGAAACGGSSSAGNQPASSDAPKKPCTADDVQVSGAFGAKPTITVPDTCTPPTQQLSKDLTPGTGAEVKTGDAVATYYDLVTWSDKQEVDSSWAHQPFQPFTVQPVGQAQVIQGWNDGLVGMKQGGRRLLIIPPDKGYGTTGNQGIKPNETLVFVVDAVTVTAAS